MESVVAIAVSLEGYYDHFLPTLLTKVIKYADDGANRARSGQV